MSPMRNVSLAVIVLVVGSALAYGVLTAKPRPEPEPPAAYQPPGVEVIVAAPAERALLVNSQGTVTPLREIQWVSQVSGKVENVAAEFAAGGFFSRGQQLLKIEDVDYQYAIARVESQVAAARQALAEEEGRSLQAKREWRDLGSQKANALFLRKPQLAAAQASVNAAEAELAAAKLDLARTVFEAPFNGRVKEKRVDIGQYVTPGTAIATLYDTDAVEIRLPLTDRQVALLELPLTASDAGAIAHSPVQIQARFANREWLWEGEIVRTDASIDTRSRVVYAVVQVKHPFDTEGASGRPPLSPGLFVHAAIAGKPLPDVMQLPRSALQTNGTVLLVDDDNRAEARSVFLLQSDDQFVWVQGLGPGERVIVSHSGMVAPGMEVRPLQESGPSVSESVIDQAVGS